ncbi:hypothetical protein PVAP13_3NG215071 [Panicum virgatum]|uniref:Uncharacterized protein n=1 Tax=Panicum virgatum TaxID=38727 RepID=A0A8T0U785_PANVG|nr:hypothetical protein PVAP13_3NG215071 [Panicum virgatum]
MEWLYFMFGWTNENGKRYCFVNHRHMRPACQSPNPLLPLSSTAGAQASPTPPCHPMAPGLFCLAPSLAVAGAPPPRQAPPLSRPRPPPECCLRAEPHPLRLRERQPGEGQPMQRGRGHRRSAACSPPRRAPPALASQAMAGGGATAAGMPPARLRAELHPLRFRERWPGEGRPVQRGKDRKAHERWPGEGRRGRC